MEHSCPQNDRSCQVGLILLRMNSFNEFDKNLSDAVEAMEKFILAETKLKLLTLIRKKFVVSGENYCVKSSDSQ